jgi:FO synthase subunit 2
LINESISTSAGAAFGQRLSPGVLRQLAYAAGRPAAERNTRYALLKSFAVGTFARDPLDDVPVDDPRFGSYDALVADPAWRYEPKPRASRDRSTPA